METENGGNHVGCVERVFEEHLVADGDVSDLVGRNAGEDVGLEPLDGGGGGGEVGEDFVGDADHDVDSGAGESAESGRVCVEEADVCYVVGFEDVDGGGGRRDVVGYSAVADSDWWWSCGRG